MTAPRCRVDHAMNGGIDASTVGRETHECVPVASSRRCHAPQSKSSIGGGARAGLGPTGSASWPRCSRIRRTTEGCSMRATRRRRPPQAAGQSRLSMSRPRRMRSAQVWLGRGGVSRDPRGAGTMRRAAARAAGSSSAVDGGGAEQGGGATAGASGAGGAPGDSRGTGARQPTPARRWS